MFTILRNNWPEELPDFVDVHTIDQLKSICAEHNQGETTYSNDLEAMFFTPSATQALYNIEVIMCIKLFFNVILLWSLDFLCYIFE